MAARRAPVHQTARTTRALSSPEAPFRPSRLHWVLCYAAYAGVLYASYQAFWLWRSTLEGYLAAALRDRDWFPPVYLGTTALVGIMIFVMVVWSESHLRGSLPTSYYKLGSYLLRLLWRLTHVALVLALVLGSAVALHEWTIRSLI
ncbi:MAG TPA: hypothetical protein VFN74_18500 [Chloroflexota bacterium]|nr:hypothetical protein [Chloroflexota bacterium]